MRRSATLTALVLVAVLLSSCVANESSPVARGHQASFHQIPWSRLSSEWSVALWSPVRDYEHHDFATKKLSLFVVTPRGGRYFVRKFPAETSLVSWSFTLDRVLVLVTAHGSASLQTVSLSSGEIVARWHVGSSFDIVGFADNAGGSVLALSHGAGGYGGFLERRSVSGAVISKFHVRVDDQSGATVSMPSGEVAVLSSPNQQTVSGRNSALRIYSSHGKVEASVDLSAYRYCRLVRWWNTSSVLANCEPITAQRSILVRVGRHGGVRAMTQVVTKVLDTSGKDTFNWSPDLMPSDGDAWRIQSGLYIQEAATCGEFLSKYVSPRVREMVSVPLAAESGSGVYGASAKRLFLQGRMECLPGRSILWYEPSHKSINVVLGPPLTGGMVTSALANPRNRS
ncbi:MAG: hypothetical protein WCL38_02685 [Actinomycetota bacterium]